MKKIICLLLCALLLAGAFGCRKKQTSPAKDQAVSGTLTEIFARIYENADLELPKLAETEITKENMRVFLGTDSFSFTEGLASEAMVSAIPFSVCLLRLPEDADVAAVKQAIKDNANPNKWICVGVDESNVIVDSIGNLVILIMADGAAEIHRSFLLLADG